MKEGGAHRKPTLESFTEAEMRGCAGDLQEMGENGMCQKWERDLNAEGTGKNPV